MTNNNKSVLSEYLYQRNLGNAIENIKSLAAKVKNFKIGKTGETLDERHGEPDYNGVYDEIDEVYSSKDPELVSRMEADLIEEFKDHPNCDNTRTTDKDEMAESDEYSVYVVWNKKK